MTTLPDLQEIVAKDAAASAAFSPAEEELDALRAAALHNMRLLKAQIVPLIDAALRSSADGDPADQRARWVATALQLIDDTVIAAAACATGGAMEPVDFGALLRRATTRQRNALGSVTIGPVPRLMARHDHLRLLSAELVSGIAWTAGQELPSGLRIDSAPDGAGDRVIWFQDANLPAPVVDALDFSGRQPLDRCWSLSQNLVARMEAALHLSRGGRGRLCLALKFPAAMVLGEGLL